MKYITLRGVEVHNLQGVDLDLPHRKLIVFCGLSGSGKSSLALDTLYAEGQRRYIESFSAYTRQFLERLEKPDAERIDGIPPAVAITSKNGNRSSRSTVGTATETADSLRLLFAKIGHVHCLECGQAVTCDSPQSVTEWLERLPGEMRYMIAFSLDPMSQIGSLIEDGFVRMILGDRVVMLGDAVDVDVEKGDRHLAANHSPEETTESARSQSPFSTGDRHLAVNHSPEETTESARSQSPFSTGDRHLAANHSPEETTESARSQSPFSTNAHIVVDRLTAGTAKTQRIRDSLETAFTKGDGACHVFVEDEATSDEATQRGKPYRLDDRAWRKIGFSRKLACDDCGSEYPLPDPRLFSFNNPMGACPECEGFGNILDVDMDLVVPDPNQTIRKGAIAPWNTPSYAHELEELLALADDFGVPVDIPFRELTDEQLRPIVEGVPERKFGGLNGFFAWLERRKYKMHYRVFLSRWRTYRPCPVCCGTRLRAESLATRLNGRHIAEISAMKVRDAIRFFRDLKLPDWEETIGRMMLDQVRDRLGYLDSVGLGYLTLDRTLRTLSGGEVRRVAMTAALGSSLVNMLYVLDEPSIGLHPRDINQLLEAIEGLRDRGNTVVVVEHEEAILRRADRLIEIGPGAGERGGRIVFEGTPDEMEASSSSLTGDYLAGRRGVGSSDRRRPPNHGWIRLAGARGNNLDNVTVEFPLGVLCLVTGVSGSGKSTLVDGTLYPALCRRLRKETSRRPLDFDDVFGDGQIDACILVDQSPIGRSPRSNPVTYLKVFDEIRAVFAETIESKTRGFTASHFSFNVKGGRCETCHGEGQIAIDMQFLADVYMKCAQCRGTRYRDEILDVTYRGRNIAEVLEMTVREAFTFFRGRPKVQARLKRLIDVGLDYVRLGQPANTLSGGEAQRLKLASYMSNVRRGRSLFLLDEPTTGLHFSDIVQLLDCFDALLSVGHSLIVVEHNLQMIRAADYIIDLGPGAADEGGRVIATGTPEKIVNTPESITGRFLSLSLSRSHG